MLKLPSKYLAITALILITPLTVTGCKKKEQPPAKAVPAAKPVATPSLPVQKQVSSVKTAENKDRAFDFSKRKDPFKAYATQPILPEQQVLRPAQRRVQVRDQLPIQSYDVGKFRVSGIIVGLKENTALVIDPTGKGYVVKPGMLIGNNDGYISKITPSSIDVIETNREDTGHITKRTVKLVLPQKK